MVPTGGQQPGDSYLTRQRQNLDRGTVTERSPAIAHICRSAGSPRGVPVGSRSGRLSGGRSGGQLGDGDDRDAVGAVVGVPGGGYYQQSGRLADPAVVNPVAEGEQRLRT